MKLHRKIDHNEKGVSRTKFGHIHVKVKVTFMSEVKFCLKLCCSLSTEAKFMKLHRKIDHNEKVCRVHELGSYAQGQGRSQVRGQNCV